MLLEAHPAFLEVMAGERGGTGGAKAVDHQGRSIHFGFLEGLAK
jgi:hypothetical protein